MISAFILFHILAFVGWSVPVNSPLVNAFRQAIRPYMLWSGLFQAWDMFAPDPSRLNGYVEAEIDFRDGETRFWKAPRMDELGFIERYYRERYRKFVNEHLRIDGDAALWPDAARHLARLYHSNPANPPVTVRLIRYWSVILPPGPNAEYSAMPWERYTYFTYAVTPEDLR